MNINTSQELIVMTDKLLVEKKLRRIEELLRELALVSVDTLENFRENIITRRFIERNIELGVEQMIDVCKHLVCSLELSEPETYSECFDILAKEGIVSKGNSETFKTMIRFRNILIHAYDGVDDSITYGIYKLRLNDFRAFIEEIRAYLHKKKI